MKTTVMILAAATVLAACATERQDAATVQTVGQWRIEVNRNAGPGCFAVRNFVNPTSEVQMGINATSTPPSGYLSIFVQGYEGMKQREATIPANGKVRLTEALERLVQLYDAWDKPNEALKWRKELEKTKEKP